MHAALERLYRIVPRGQAGLSCDAEGVALGALDVARTRTDAAGVRRCKHGDCNYSPRTHLCNSPTSRASTKKVTNAAPV